MAGLHGLCQNTRSRTYSPCTGPGQLSRVSGHRRDRHSLFSCFFIMSCDSPRSACPQLQITGKIRIIIGKYWIGELDAILYFDKTILFLNNFKIMIFFKKSTVFCCLENTLDYMESHQGLHPDGRAWNPELFTPCRKQQMLSDQEDVSFWRGH